MSIIRKTYRLFALSMAILMLCTSAGLAVDMHFCGGKLVSISFFGEADTCIKPGTGQAGCRAHYEADLAYKQLQISKKACCEDRFFQIQTEQNQKTEQLNWEIHKPDLSYFFLKNTPAKPSLPSDQSLSLNAFYHPPSLCRALHLLGQCFLL